MKISEKFSDVTRFNKKMTEQENFYRGTYSTLEPAESPYSTGYRLASKAIGSPHVVSPETEDALKGTSTLLSQGMKTVELQPLSPDIFETIPKDHLKEVNRLAKLTGSETTLHIIQGIDPAGFTDRGWSEESRKENERRLLEAVKRSYELNPQGNVPVTIHASHTPAYEKTPDGETLVVGVDRVTGELAPFRGEVSLGEDEETREIKPREVSPMGRIKIANESMWNNQIAGIEQENFIHGREARRVIGENNKIIEPYVKKIERGEHPTEEESKKFNEAAAKSNEAYSILKHIDTKVRSAFDKAYEYGDNNIKEILNKAASKYGEYIKVGNVPEADSVLLASFDKITPEFYAPSEKFALDKASKTIGNVAFEAWKKFEDKAPILCMENFWPGTAFSSADGMKKLIEESREKFVENAVKEGISRGEAKKAASALIGATWDLGHIAMMKKAGFKDEAIVEETRKIAPFVKHVHITDNFGYADTHLAPGMGTVPIKKMMEAMEKAGYSGKAIMEAGGFVRQYKVSPHPYVLEAMGSPLYTMQVAPTWKEARGAYGTYFMAGYMAGAPEQHVSLYGLGFSGMPAELGGTTPGKRSRFAGAPTE